MYREQEEMAVIEKLTKAGRQATTFEFEKQGLSPDTENVLNIIPPEIKTESSKYTLLDFYKKRLATRRRFFRKLSPEEIMKWSNSMISSPLLNIPSELEETSYRLFKYLMSYMGDRRSAKKPIKNVKKHLELTLNSPEDLKDEAYVQVLKQIKDHKSYDRTIRGWNFFAILASCYAPSTDLYYGILNYLFSEIKTNTDPNIIKKSNYISMRLIHAYESKRKQIPSEEEILHIENMKQWMFPIHFFSDTHTLVPTESYTNVIDLKTSIMKKLQLNVTRIPYYALYEVCIKDNVTEERFLDDLDRFVDILATWANEKEEYEKLKKHIEFKIYLKIQIYYPFKEDDIDTITLHYVQTNYDVISGKFKLSEEEIVQLAAIQLQIDCEKKSFEEASSHLERHSRNYVPSTRYKPAQASIWCSKIMEYYTNNFKFKSRIESKLTYLESLKNNVLFEAHQLYVTFSKTFNPTNYENFPDNLILAIRPNGISIMDSDKNDMKFIFYNQIISWGVNNNTFVVVVPKNEYDYSKYYFESPQTRVINWLMNSYTNLIAGKNINDILSSNYSFHKRFDSMPSMKLKKGESVRSRTSTAFKRNNQE